MSDQVDECLAGGAESLAKMQRAERLMRARKAALSIGMDRISEKDSLHRSLRHSSVRAEVTHLTEQSRAKDNELKEARLYIQRLEQVRYYADTGIRLVLISKAYLSDMHRLCRLYQSRA
jgi:hypothetical protein